VANPRSNALPTVAKLAGAPPAETPQTTATNVVGNNDKKEAKESKESRFKRLANMRVPKAIKLIRNIANLANRNQYEYTDEQVHKLIIVLDDEVDALRSRFAGSAKAAEVTKLF
jgi:hypothetical protein